MLYWQQKGKEQEIIQLIKNGSLFSRLTHEAVAGIAGENAGFTLEETNILIEHCNDPDYHDYLFDRFWNHFYEPNAFIGGAPQACKHDYQVAVNGRDLVSLACASHYIMDVGCVFHTTFMGQWLHLPYEGWIDENIDEIIGLIDLDSIQLVVVNDVELAVRELAILSNQRYQTIVGFIEKNDMENLKIETANNLRDVISYTWGLFDKYIYDVENEVIYEEKSMATLNAIVFLTVVTGLPMLAYYVTKEPTKIIKRG